MLIATGIAIDDNHTERSRKRVNLIGSWSQKRNSPQEKHCFARSHELPQRDNPSLDKEIKAFLDFDEWFHTSVSLVYKSFLKGIVRIQ